MTQRWGEANECGVDRNLARMNESREEIDDARHGPKGDRLRTITAHYNTVICVIHSCVTWPNKHPDAYNVNQHFHLILVFKYIFSYLLKIKSLNKICLIKCYR